VYKRDDGDGGDDDEDEDEDEDEDKDANSDEDESEIATETYASPSIHSHILSFYRFLYAFCQRPCAG
jgi:protein involved in sex pheromone biosynthesis